MGFTRLWVVGLGIFGRLRVGRGRDGGYQQGPVIGDVVDVFAHGGVESDSVPDISGFKLQASRSKLKSSRTRGKPEVFIWLL